jgi:hypothetical protein
MKTTIQWKASDQTGARYLGPVEFQTNAGEWVSFEILAQPDRVIFGGQCNACFLESGHILREDYESEDDTLREMLADLETYYNDGPQYVSRITCNARM